jgi:hypothetical protein
MFERENLIWDYLINHNIASEETLQIITSINGLKEETLNDVLFVVTGYRTIEQYEEEYAIEWED